MSVASPNVETLGYSRVSLRDTPDMVANVSLTSCAHLVTSMLLFYFVAFTGFDHSAVFENDADEREFRFFEWFF